MADESPESPQRWTAKRRVGAGGKHPQGRDVGGGSGPETWLTVAEVDEWRERFLLGAENALRLDLGILKEATKDRPFPPKTSDE